MRYGWWQANQWDKYRPIRLILLSLASFRWDYFQLFNSRNRNFGLNLTKLRIILILYYFIVYYILICILSYLTWPRSCKKQYHCCEVNIKIKYNTFKRPYCYLLLRCTLNPSKVRLQHSFSIHPVIKIDNDNVALNYKQNYRLHPLSTYTCASAYYSDHPASTRLGIF